MQVREYAKLTCGSKISEDLDHGVVAESCFDWLLELGHSWKKGAQVLVLDGRNTIRLGSYVGYLQSPCGHGIEILPKTQNGDENPEEAREILRTMLASAMGLKPNEAGPADLMRLDQPLHEWIFSRFLGELKKFLSRGLRYHYERVAEDERFLRGQLNTVRQMRQGPGKANVFAIRHDVYTPNRIENRLIKTALEFTSRCCRQAENWRLANELMHQLDNITALRSPLECLKDWQHNRLMQHYQPIYPWIKLIIEQLNPSFQQGFHRGIALLFPMERLFEIFVSDRLNRWVYAGAKLSAQATSQFLVAHVPRQNAKAERWFQMRPDLLLSYNNQQQVLDTKWKLIDEQACSGESKYDVKQADLYQLFAYGHKYQQGTGHLMLIYPQHKGFQQSLPAFSFSEDLKLWVVPFSLKQEALVMGEWAQYFPLYESSNKTTGLGGSAEA